MNQIKQCNKQLDLLQKQLIKQLETTNIEYIDLFTYYKQIEQIKNKKHCLFIDSY